VYVIRPESNVSASVYSTIRLVAFTFAFVAGVTVPNEGPEISYVIPVLVTVVAVFPAKSVPSMVNVYIAPSTNAPKSISWAPGAKVVVELERS